MQSLKSRIFFALGLTVFVILWCCRFGYAVFHPTFFMDEAYYIGAARAIMRGDLLLTGYSFDKVFLQAFLPVPGMLLGQEQTLGYRLSSVIFWWVGFAFWFQNARRLFGKSAIGSLTAWCLAAGLYLQPWLNTYSVSPMAESALLLIFALMVRTILSGEPQGRTALFWGLAVATKQTAILWGFQLLRSWNWRTYWSQFLVIWSATKWIFALILVWMLTGPSKLALLTMSLGNMGKGGEGGRGWFEAASFWVKVLVASGSGLSALVIAFSIYGVWRLRRSEAGEQLRFLGFAVLAHLGILFFLRASFYERYYVIIFAQIFWLAILALYNLKWRPWITLGVAIVPLVVSTWGKFHLNTENPQRGREWGRLADEVPANAIVHFSTGWMSRPYERSGQEIYSCTDDCINEVRRARPLLKDQWVFSYEGLEDDVTVRRMPFLSHQEMSCYKASTSERRYEFSQEKLIQAFLDRMRLAGAADLVDVKVDAETQDLMIRLKFRKPALGFENLNLRLSWVTGGLPPDERGSRVVRVGLRLKTAHLETLDVTDIVATLRKGPVVWLPGFELPEGPFERLESLKLAADLSHTESVWTTVKYDEGCRVF